MSEKLLPENSSQHSLFSNSRRVYVAGSWPDLQVPMREISLSPSRLSNCGGELPNEPVRVYDTFGCLGRSGLTWQCVFELPRLRAFFLLIVRSRDDSSTFLCNMTVSSHDEDC
jgi:phosphomethylpyrimidine synthase